MCASANAYATLLQRHCAAAALFHRQPTPTALAALEFQRGAASGRIESSGEGVRHPVRPRAPHVRASTRPPRPRARLTFAYVGSPIFRVFAAPMPPRPPFTCSKRRHVDALPPPRVPSTHSPLVLRDASALRPPLRHSERCLSLHSLPFGTRPVRLTSLPWSSLIHPPNAPCRSFTIQPLKSPLSLFSLALPPPSVAPWRHRLVFSTGSRRPPRPPPVVVPPCHVRAFLHDRGAWRRGGGGGGAAAAARRPVG